VEKLAVIENSQLSARKTASTLPETASRTASAGAKQPARRNYIIDNGKERGAGNQGPLDLCDTLSMD